MGIIGNIWTGREQYLRVRYVASKESESSHHKGNKIKYKSTAYTAYSKILNRNTSWVFVPPTNRMISWRGCGKQKHKRERDMRVALSTFLNKKSKTNWSIKACARTKKLIKHLWYQLKCTLTLWVEKKTIHIILPVINY